MVAGAGLVLLCALTGRSASPFVVLVVPLLNSAGARTLHPARVFVPGFLLVALSLLFDGRGWDGLWLALALTTASVITYLLMLRQTIASTLPKRAAPTLIEAATNPLEQAVEGVRVGLRARRTILWRLAVDSDRAVPWIMQGGTYAQAVGLSGDVLGWAAHQRICLRVDPPPDWVEAEVRGCAVAPVASDALLSLEFDDARELPEIDDLERAAAYLAAVIELERERAIGMEQRGRMNALLALLRQLPAEIEPLPLAQQLVDAGLKLTGAHAAALAEWDGNEGRVLAVAGYAQSISPNTKFSGESVTALAARAGSTIARVAPERLLPLFQAKEMLAVRPRAMAALPLHGGGRVVGTLTLWSPEEQFDAAGLEALAALLPYAGLQFSHAQAFGLMRERADHDRLTGLLNRQAFDAQLSAEYARFHRYERPFALLLIDVDHFKNVNDRYGHPVGDAVLNHVGTVVAGTLREVDTAARYGGEEFAVLLPETGLHSAREIAERIRVTLVEAEAITHAGRIPVTASFGVAACPETARDPDSLVRAADGALYHSKAAGRNRVSLAVAPAPAGKQLR